MSDQAYGERDNSRDRERRFGIRAAVAITSLIAAGVGVAAIPTAGDVAVAAPALQPFDSCAGLRTWFVNAALESVGPYGLQMGNGRIGVSGAEAVTMVASAASRDMAASQAPRAAYDADAAGSGDTGTNVQEAGVDEADTVKTRDGIVYTVDGQRLTITRVDGDKLTRLDSVTLPRGAASELLIAGDRAVVLGQRWDEPRIADSSARSYSPMGGMSSTTATTIDISDPARARVLRTDEFAGGYLSAREHAGVVRLVIRSQPDLPFEMPAFASRTPSGATRPPKRTLEPSTAMSSATRQWTHGFRSASSGTTTARS